MWTVSEIALALLRFRGHITIILSNGHLLKDRSAFSTVLRLGHIGPGFALVYMCVVHVMRAREEDWFK